MRYVLQGISSIIMICPAFCTPSASRNVLPGSFLTAHRMQSTGLSIGLLFPHGAERCLPAWQGFYKKMSGSRLLCHAVSSIVPSAARIFTVVFGMGTGVASARIATRQNLSKCSNLSENLFLFPSYENPTETQPLLSSLERR